MHRYRLILFVGALLLVPSLLLARPGKRQAPPVQKGHTLFDYSYEEGVLVEKQGTRYDAEGFVVGYSNTSFEYLRRKPFLTIRVEYDAEMVLRSTHQRDYLYEGKKNLGYDVLHTDTDGRQVQRVEARNHVMVDQLGMVQEMRVFNRLDDLVQIRYIATDRDEQGHLVARDTSIFDQDSIQRSRHLHTWTYDEDGKVVAKGIEIFDEDDQRLRMEEATVNRPDRLGEISEWVLSDKDGAITGYRDREVRFDIKKKVRNRTTTFYDGEGYAIRRVVENLVYDKSGHLAAVRSRTEHF